MTLRQQVLLVRARGVTIVCDLLPTSASLADYIVDCPRRELENMPMQANNNKNPAREHPDLDRRYGAIGISAVAAAVRYQSDGKNPAYAPADAQALYEHEDVAA
jgi:hypothetical protein